ncbi:hypothetical protein Calab_0120 [Caldithrix abyssi DSM 13497]|uniref:Lipocalin-like domain-containing protein n=1 Tax=Caldithrix abyssi DSM 13497 TaxID=880073 RepID=H1XXV0_CALAY|nr:hypothetical protein [Caldithrix abyssi]APF19657.1 hypothetical protein Cabys_2909 [Caldithrix abyssi DSM 13497]EHO39773.1 hypothetical protein Calab_0120 [Caldithrix abyssi DSM 13497]
MLNRNYLIILAAVSLLIFACGQSGLNNPVGVLGGSNEGYGNKIDFSGNDGEFDLPADGNELIGTWRSYQADMGGYIYLTFYSDGKYEFEVEVYESRQIFDRGSYEVNGNTITFYSDSGPVNHSEYYIEGNNLYLDGEKFTRV